MSIQIARSRIEACATAQQSTLDLSDLRLTDTDLISLRSDLGKVTRLHLIDLGLNLLKRIPDLHLFTELRELRAPGNRIEQIFNSSSIPESVEVIDLSGNRIFELPEFFVDLYGLRNLDLSGNQLVSLPVNIGNLRSMDTLDIGGNKIRTLPPSIGLMGNLHGLYMGSNELNSIPDQIGNLRKLATLDASDNHISSLPEAIGNLSALTTLDLRSNHLIECPTSIGNLKSLVSLYLYDNNLTRLPETLGFLNSLTTLYVYNNSLKSLPDSFGRLASLTTLYAYGNEISLLPHSLGHLENLTSLDVSGNNLTDLPRSLGGLKNLRVVYAFDNPLPPEMAAAAEESSDELLRFLNLIHREGILVSEVKLLFVGEGGVGKTSLLAALRGEPWVEGREQTHGLDIKPLVIGQDENAITFNGWDFGGQKNYRPTHQIFFTTPAVYVVVWKPRTGAEQGLVEQWLETIQHRAGAGARVHIVATHGGPERRQDFIDEERLRERFGKMIADFHDVDSLFPETLHELKKSIAQTGRLSSHSKRWYPKSWRRVREALLDYSEQWFAYDEYEIIANSYGLSQVGARSLAMSSHALGTWIYYADEPTLAQVIVLKPDWLSVAIAAVLEDRQAAEGSGLVTHRRFGQIWGSPSISASTGYSHFLQQIFLRLMERFELTYRVPELSIGEPVSLVAQLVPASRPDLESSWEVFRKTSEEAIEVCQIIERQTDRIVTPEGLIYRLIVRLHHQSLNSDSSRLGTHWRGGLITESRYGARALITLTVEGIKVQVRGTDPYTYLRQVVDEVRDCVDGFWPGLTTRALLPCTIECGLGTPGRGLFDVDKLLKARDRNLQVVACPALGCDNFPTIESLLEGGTNESPANRLNNAHNTVAFLSSKLDDIAASQTSGLITTLARLHDLGDDMNGRLSRTENALLTLLRSLDDEAAEGPRIFSLTPADQSVLRPGWTTRRMKLTLYCEYSRYPLYALEPGQPNLGVYDVDIPREWWVKAVPFLRITSAIIKPFLGIGLAAAELGLNDTQWQDFQERINLGKETLNAAAEAAELENPDDEASSLGPSKNIIIEASGGTLRRFHALLKEQDISFADLRRVRNQQGRYLWVHSQFSYIFQPPLPNIPT